MNYYITQNTYCITKDNKQTLCETQEFHEDIPEDKIEDMGRVFYEELLDITKYVTEHGTVSQDSDFLYIQTIYTDKEQTNIVLESQYKESQIKKDLYTHKSTIIKELGPCVLIAQVFLPNEFSDVLLTRERIYQLANGQLIYEQALNIQMEYGDEWEYNRQKVNQGDAQAWLLKYKNETTFQQFQAIK